MIDIWYILDRYCIDIWNIFNRYMIENYTEKLGYNLKNLI